MRRAALRSDLIDPTIAVHHGRVVKRTGDGAVVEFRSVVDAVNCAIEVQKAMVERNAGVPEDRTPPGPQWEAGIAEADAAAAINPNLAGPHAISGYWRLFLGRAGEGFSGIETAIKLSPRDPVRPIWEHWICHLHSHLAQWEQALGHCRLAAQGAPSFWFPYADIVAANGWLERDAEAKAALADLQKLKPDLTTQAYAALAATFSDNAVFTQQVARMVEGMRKAGLPEQ